MGPMSREGGTPPDNLLWRTRVMAAGRVREMQCTFERLADESFELRVSFGDSALVSESFTDREAMLAKAEELREALSPARARRRARAGRVGPQ